MDDTDAPLKIPAIWANTASPPYVATVPTPSQEGVKNGAASFDTGFPPNCFVPVAAGGAGPFGLDLNGIFQQITQGLQWQQAGGPTLYDGTFQTNIGGYPKGALIASVAYPGIVWQSTTDNNVTDPDTGGGGWALFPRIQSQLLVGDVTPGTRNFTVPAGIFIIFLQVVGAGGGGAGHNTSTTTSGGGGGAGGFGQGWVSVTPGQVISRTIGAAGAAGATGTSGTDGGNGGSSSVGSFISCTGGGGGLSTASAAGGGPGTPTIAGTGFGADGGDGGDGSGLQPTYFGGNGGASFFGGGSRATAIGTLPTTCAPGSGGGGGYAGAAGIPGVDGAVLIWG